jgi:hypothetical protein
MTLRLRVSLSAAIPGTGVVYAGTSPTAIRLTATCPDPLIPAALD